LVNVLGVEDHVVGEGGDEYALDREEDDEECVAEVEEESDEGGEKAFEFEV
jgi:hypothetical protein